MLVQIWPVKYGQVSFQHARLLASSPVGLSSDRAPDRALDADGQKHISCSRTALENQLILDHFLFLLDFDRSLYIEMDDASSLPLVVQK